MLLPISITRGQEARMLPFSVPITDTTPAARAVQLEIHRSMTGEQKILLAYEMSMAGRELNRARLRQEHPEWTEAQIARELLRLAFFPKPLPPGFK
jgi:Rv0078B-related antitoxin